MAQTAIMAVLSDINCPLSGCLYASTAHTGIKSLSREHEGTLTQTELAITMQIPLSAKPWFPPVGGIFDAGGTPLGKCRTPFRLIKINWGFCFIKAPEFNAWAGGGYTELWCLVGIWGPHTRQHSWAPGCFATLVVCSLVMCFFKTRQSATSNHKHRK